MTKEKVESHLLDIALFLDSLQESVEFLLWTLGSGETPFLDSSLLVKPKKLDTLVFILALLCKKAFHPKVGQNA